MGPAIHPETEHPVDAVVQLIRSRVGDDASRARVASDIARLVRSDRAEDRALAARMSGAVEPSDGLGRTALRRLLDDGWPAKVEFRK